MRSLGVRWNAGGSVLLALVLGAGACDGAAAPAVAPKVQPWGEPAFDRYRRPDLLLAALALQGGERVADLGAGRGYLTLRLAAAVGALGLVVATDVDADALGELRSRHLQMEDSGIAKVETRQVRRDDPGLAAEHYDLILLSEVDHLLPDRMAYLRRLGSHLAPGGRLVICNRRHNRAAVLDAARAAGLSVRGEYVHLPAHFLLFFGGPP